MSFELSIRHQQPDLQVEFKVPSAGIVGVFGPSGSGKTSVLRSIAGLLQGQSISVNYNGSDWNPLSLQKRPIIWMGQEPHLFPHWRVEKNLKFALEQNDLDLAACDAYTESLQCDTLMARMPQQLSGGEYQRVCLLRALALSQGSSHVLLLDEPLSALNEKLRHQALHLISRLREEKLVFFVSHHLEDMYRLCDHLILMDEGRVLNSGPLPSMMSSVDHDLRKAFHYPLNDKKYLIYAHEVALSLQPLNGISIRHGVGCRIQECVPYQSNYLLKLVDQHDQLILAEITAEALSELGLETGREVHALFKSTGLVEVF